MLVRNKVITYHKIDTWSISTWLFLAVYHGTHIENSLVGFSLKNINIQNYIKFFLYQLVNLYEKPFVPDHSIHCFSFKDNTLFYLEYLRKQTRATPSCSLNISGETGLRGYLKFI